MHTCSTAILRSSVTVSEAFGFPVDAPMRTWDLRPNVGGSRYHNKTQRLMFFSFRTGFARKLVLVSETRPLVSATDAVAVMPAPTNM